MKECLEWKFKENRKRILGEEERRRDWEIQPSYMQLLVLSQLIALAFAWGVSWRDASFQREVEDLFFGNRGCCEQSFASKWRSKMRGLVISFQPRNLLSYRSVSKSRGASIKPNDRKRTSSFSDCYCINLLLPKPSPHYTQIMSIPDVNIHPVATGLAHKVRQR